MQPSYIHCHHGMGMQSERERSHCDHLVGIFFSGGGGGGGRGGTITMGSCLDAVTWGREVGRGGGISCS